MRYVQVCKALYDYESRTEDELSIKENDVLYIIEKEDEDWWRAELKQQNGEDQGPVGLVPVDYLEEVSKHMITSSREDLHHSLPGYANWSSACRV